MCTHPGGLLAGCGSERPSVGVLETPVINARPCSVAWLQAPCTVLGADLAVIGFARIRTTPRPRGVIVSGQPKPDTGKAGIAAPRALPRHPVTLG